VRTLSFLALFALPVAVVLTPASSTASIYSWKDANGVTIYSNDPPAERGNAEVAVRPAEAVPSEPSGPESSGIELASEAEPRMPQRAPYKATEGEFVIQLARELGLGQPADDETAADALTNLRIEPALGEWRFDRPMTPELTVRLRQLTVAAAERGAISITPEQALLAFDTAAALLNVDIPAAADQTAIPDDPYPIADMPPLINFYPPEPVYSPYYIWTPIAGGFWWGDAFFSGYFVLNVPFFCNHYYDHYYYDNGYTPYNRYTSGGRHHDDRSARSRFASIDPGHISRHMRGHIEDHQLRARPAPNGGRTVSSPGQPRAPFPPPYPSMRSGGSDRAGLRASRSTAAPDRVSFTRSIRSSRTPLSPPADRSQAHRSRSYRSPSYRSSSTVSQWTGRGAYPSASIHRAGVSGFGPAQPSYRGGMQTARGGGASFGGGQTQHSSGGFSQVGTSFRR